MQKTIEAFLNEEVKEYSISVIKDRAIPSVVDGFKPSQRKIIFAALAKARSFLKTTDLAGYVSAIAGYDKGDASVPETIIKMTQNFAGSNNVPFIEGDGSFGNRFLPKGWAAPRYTKVKLSGNFHELFKDLDILTYTEQGTEGTFEPDFYVPIIPSILLNSPSGIAVGFACEFQPYNINEITTRIFEILQPNKAKAQTQLIPHFQGFKGTIEWDADLGKYVQTGCITFVKPKKGFAYSITEIPTGISREKYIDHLDGMIEKNLINDYEDNCDQDGFNFEVKVSFEQQMKLEEGKLLIHKMFGLQKTLHSNMNCISENNRLLHFDTPDELLKYFVKFRLKFLSKRKANKISVLNHAIGLNQEKIKFIKAVQSDKFKLKFKSRAEMKKAIVKAKFKFVDNLMDMPVYNITGEYIEKLQSLIKDDKVELAYYEKVTEKQLYLTDLGK